MKDYKPDNDTVYYDLECKILDVPDLYKELIQYAPFGEGNKAITFKVDNISGIPKIIGKLKNHFKLQGPDVTLLGFDLVEKWIDEGEPSTLDVIGTLGVNHYKDKDLYQIRLIMVAVWLQILYGYPAILTSSIVLRLSSRIRLAKLPQVLSSPVRKRCSLISISPAAILLLRPLTVTT